MKTRLIALFLCFCFVPIWIYADSHGERQCYLSINNIDEVEPAAVRRVSLSLISKYVEKVEEIPLSGVSSGSCQYEVTFQRSFDGALFARLSGPDVEGFGESEQAGVNGVEQALLRALYLGRESRRERICEDFSSQLAEECQDLEYNGEDEEDRLERERERTRLKEQEETRDRLEKERQEREKRKQKMEREKFKKEQVKKERLERKKREKAKEKSRRDRKERERQERERQERERREEDPFYSDQDSSGHRENRSMMLEVEVLNSNRLWGDAVAADVRLGFYLDSSVMMGLKYRSSIEEREFGLYFLIFGEDNSFNGKVGFSYGTEYDSNEEVEENEAFFNFGVGNQWMLDSGFVISCEWINIPMTLLSFDGKGEIKDLPGSFETPYLSVAIGLSF